MVNPKRNKKRKRKHWSHDTGSRFKRFLMVHKKVDFYIKLEKMVYRASDGSISVGVQLRQQPSQEECREARGIVHMIPSGVETLKVNIAVCAGLEDSKRQDDAVIAWRPLLDLISNRDDIKTITLCKNGQRQHKIFGCIMRAILKSTSIRNVVLDDVYLPYSEIWNFLNAATSIKNLTLTGNIISSGDNEVATVTYGRHSDRGP